MTYRFLILICAVLVCACGGGDSNSPPSVSSVSATNLNYGQIATLTVRGNALQSTLKLSSAACSQIVLGSSTSNTSLTAQCVVVKTGDQTITASSGTSVLYTGKLSVPEPQVTLTTSLGTIVMELNPTAAPITVNNLLTYAARGFYTNTLFHRVVPGFVIQGGGFTSELVQKTDTAAAIKLESQNGLSNTRGTVAMARTDVPDSATSQFFINLVDNSKTLNFGSSNSPEGYAVFGTVVIGLDVADAIARVKTATVRGNQNVPVTEVLIQSVVQTQ